MKIYLVGGAVRDQLLGLPIKERDWVVVGASVTDMLKLGYRQVGKEFPVFLHPRTSEEYALARMERKIELGYQGFAFDASPEVTLEEDLRRRDLTINAMAKTNEGVLIDLYHGKQDLENRILRHVSEAFSEDPVRILRLGRFLARYAYLGFHIAPETMALMRKMVAAGEVNALVAERVWKELERGLAEKNPEKFFEVLANCGALPILFPHLEMEGAGMKALIAAAKLTSDPIVRFAALFYALPENSPSAEATKKSITALCHRYRSPILYRELALLTSLHHREAISPEKLSAESLLKLFSGLDIFRRKKRLPYFLTACEAIADSLGLAFHPDCLIACAHAAKSVDVQALLAKGLKGTDIAIELKEKRLERIEVELAKFDIGNHG